MKIHDIPDKGREKTARTTDSPACAIYLATGQSYNNNIHTTRTLQPDNFTPSNPLVTPVPYMSNQSDPSYLHRRFYDQYQVH